MAFNRYDILTAKYTKEIEQWDWDCIKEDALTNCFVDEDNIIASSWLGTPFGIYPSGKIYTFWTSNQTRSDVIKDACFIEALERVAEENGMFISYDEDISAQIVVEDIFRPEIRFITEEDYDKAIQLNIEEAEELGLTVNKDIE